jgi:phosphoribosyl 1,2-cyclic phosphodiesterase
VSLRFCSLASGSRGNALLVETSDTLILVDCGLTFRTLESRLSAVGRSPQDIEAVLVTHEHSDHISGLTPLSRRLQRPVWSTHGTAKSLADIGDHRVVRYGVEFSVGNATIHPFPVPHDAREPVQFRFEADGLTLGVLTDTGHVSTHVSETLASVDALAVEFNHDLDTLNGGPYPPHLKARVGSNFGHLNNAQAAGLVANLDHDRLRWVVALHMSQQNNSSEQVESCVAEMRDGARFDFWQATQGVPTDWFELS